MTDAERERILAQPLDRLARAREIAARDAAMLPTLLEDAVLVLGVLGRRSPRARVLARAIVTGAEVAAALVALAPTGDALVSIGGRPVPLSGSVDPIRMEDQRLDGLALACVARRWDLAAAIATLPTDTAGPTPDLPALVAAIGADPAVLADPDVLDASLRGRLDGHALALDADHPRALVVLPALGLACLAVAAGLPPRVEDPRLPRYLVLGPTRSRPTRAELDADVERAAGELAQAAHTMAPVEAPPGAVDVPTALSDLRRAADLANRATPLLRALAAGFSIPSLAPRPDDFAHLFMNPAAVAAKWAAAPPSLRVAVPRDHTDLDVVAVPAWGLRSLPQARDLPGGYARAAPHLVPQSIWISARFRIPGATLGVRLDGLTERGGRWIWIPRPWRLLG
jgi:hypothetical protein